MNIDESILSKIYMSQNCDAQPVKADASQANERKNVSGSKPEGDKSLENRTIFQVDGKKYDLTSADFRVALYAYAKGQGGLEKELPMIRQRLGLTDKGESQVERNKALDTRSVINEIFARQENVQAKIDAALMGVVKFPKNVQTEIRHAIWRQRDNPGIRKFLQTGGSSQDLAAICKLTLDSMKAHSRKDFAHRMVMSYLKGFTLGMTTSPIAFSTEFEKSFEEEQETREERTGTENRRSLELQRLKVITKEAMTKLENATKELLPEPSKKELTAGEKYLRRKHEDVKWDLESECRNLKTMLANASAEVLGGLLDRLDKMLDEKVEKCVNDMNRFRQQSKRLDLLAKLDPKSDTVFGAVPKDPKEKSRYDQACKKFKADYDKAMTFAEGEMWKHLSELKEEELSDEGLKKIWDTHYKPVGEAPKNEPSSGNKNVNRLDDYVLNNTFKKGILPKPAPSGSQYDNAAYLKDLEETKKLFREKIIPNWTTLTSRLAELRRKTMEILEIGPDLEAWFKGAYPELDESSETFMDKVRNEKIEGKSVEEVENRILANCRLKNQVLFAPTNDGKSVLLCFALGEDPTGTEDANTICVKSVEDIKGNKYEQYIAQFAKERGLNNDGYKCNSAYLTPINEILDTSGNIASVNDAFKRDRQKLSQSLQQVMKSLTSEFTETERLEIEGMIRTAVVRPITDAQNIWDIKPLVFMNNFVRKCVDGGVHSGVKDIMTVVKEIVERQVAANFKLVEGEKKCLIASGKTVAQNENESPREIIESAIQGKKGLAQKGGNNCFMVSIVNALLGNEKGQQVLKQCFGGDGKYRFKNMKGEPVELTDAEVGQWVEKDDKLAQMSKLERVIWAAWLKARFATPDAYDRDQLGKDAPGNQCGVSEFAFLFGLTTANSRQGNAIDGVALPGSQLSRWVETQKHLASGQIAIVHQGEADRGHYMAITGAVSDDKGNNKHFTCSDSANSQARFELEEVQVDSSKSDPGLRQIFLLTLPEDVA